jgi:hypothetical protein
MRVPILSVIFMLSLNQLAFGCLTQPTYLQKFNKHEFVFVGTVVGHTHYYSSKLPKGSRPTQKWPQAITLDKGGVIIEEKTFLYKPEDIGSRYEILDTLFSCGRLGSSFAAMKRSFPVGAKVVVVGQRLQNDTGHNDLVPLWIPDLGVFHSYQGDDIDVSLTSDNKFDFERARGERTLFELRKEFLRLESETDELARYEQLKRLILSTPDETPINVAKLFQSYIPNDSLRSKLTAVYVQNLKEKGWSDRDIQNRLYMQRVFY